MKETSPQETYGQVVQRLEEVVKKLEAGELPLEDSLKAFEEGINLVKRGERLLNEADRRIEELLEVDGEDRAVPLDVSQAGAGAPAPRTPKTIVSSRPEKDDIPF